MAPSCSPPFRASAWSWRRLHRDSALACSRRPLMKRPPTASSEPTKLHSSNARAARFTWSWDHRGTSRSRPQATSNSPSSICRKKSRPTLEPKDSGVSLHTQVVRTPRIGFGWDSHEFKAGIPLKIGGLTLPHHSGLAGHSDGDILLHALTDALLGAVAAGDIGSYFPPSDPQWKGADSAVFLAEAVKQINARGYTVGN